MCSRPYGEKANNTFTCLCIILKMLLPDIASVGKKAIVAGAGF